jgi:hypothetical protein
MSSQQSVTSADLAAFEQRILSSFRAVVDEVVDKSLHAIDERVAKLESIVTQLQSSTSSSSASTVAAAATAPAAPNTVQVQVRTIAGDLPPVEISAVATVSDLKRMIVHEESASKRRHLLLPASDSAPAGIELIDEKKTLQECGVQSGVVLSLVVDDFQTINQVCILFLFTRLQFSKPLHIRDSEFRPTSASSKTSSKETSLLCGERSSISAAARWSLMSMLQALRPRLRRLQSH